jgi:hypothetical protein
MQTAACHTRRAAYLHNRNTTTLRARTTDSVIVVVSHLLSVTRGAGSYGRFPHVQSFMNARRALRRDQREREMHFSQASVPSFVSAPQAHIRPVRQPIRRDLKV